MHRFQPPSSARGAQSSELIRDETLMDERSGKSCVSPSRCRANSASITAPEPRKLGINHIFTGYWSRMTYRTHLTFISVALTSCLRNCFLVMAPFNRWILGSENVSELLIDRKYFIKNMSLLFWFRLLVSFLPHNSCVEKRKLHLHFLIQKNPIEK